MFVKDYGPKPLVFNINKATIQNNNFRTTIWTGCNLQITLMSRYLAGYNFFYDFYK